MGYTKREDCLDTEQKEQCGGGLFLTNNANTLELYHWLRERYPFHLYDERLNLQQIQDMNPDLVISFNYRYFIEEDVIAYMKGNIFNLHISYLPWNRGSSPNIWSFIDNTPKGVTIHQVDSGYDTGKILYQKQCFFDIEKETFASTYQMLHNTIIELFKEKWNEIRLHKYVLSDQAEGGSCHTKKDLKNLDTLIKLNWNENIKEFLLRYQKIQG